MFSITPVISDASEKYTEKVVVSSDDHDGENDGKYILNVPLAKKESE